MHYVMAYIMDYIKHYVMAYIMDYIMHYVMAYVPAGRRVPLYESNMFIRYNSIYNSTMSQDVWPIV